MKRPGWPVTAKERRATTLAAIILLQSICAVFFAGDVLKDLMTGDHLDDLHMVLEAVAALGLTAGVVFLMIELKTLLTRMDAMDTGLKVARGQMSEVMRGFFGQWNLTDAERDVAMMILKGLDNEAIAEVRQTAPGTVRAQATSIYAKSDTHGRAQFISLFVEELMSGEFGKSDLTGASLLKEGLSGEVGLAPARGRSDPDN